MQSGMRIMLLHQRTLLKRMEHSKLRTWLIWRACVKSIRDTWWMAPFISKCLCDPLHSKKMVPLVERGYRGGKVVPCEFFVFHDLICNAVILQHWRIQDFPGGANPLFWSKNLLFDKTFAENCVKNERNWIRDASLAPPHLDPPMNSIWYFIVTVSHPK